MDISTLTPADLAYIEGFVKQCQDKRVDPEAMLEKMAKSCKPAAKKGKGAFGGKAAPRFGKKALALPPHMIPGAAQAGASRAAGLAAKIKAAIPAVAGTAVGGAIGAGTMGVIDKQGQADEGKKKEDGPVKKVVGAAGKGALAGAGIGGVAGAMGAGGAGALALHRGAGAGMSGPDKIAAMLKVMLAGGTLGAAGGAVQGGLVGGAAKAAL